jgi:hypothetical protein
VSLLDTRNNYVAKNVGSTFFHEFVVLPKFGSPNHGYVELSHLSVPAELIGKKIRLKVEVLNERP